MVLEFILVVVERASMLGLERLTDQTNLDRMEILGVTGLSLLIIAPIVYVLFYRVVNYTLGVLGIGEPIPLYAAGIIFVSALVVAVWAAFEVVERYYS